MSAPASTSHWFCVHTKPRAEIRALEHLERQQFQCMLPRIRRVVPATRLRPRQSIVEPLFPRYLFLRADPVSQSLAPVRSTCGVVGLVRFAGEPARVADCIIARLFRDAGPSGVIVPPEPTFKPGDAVCIVAGPLSGLTGVYAQAQGRLRALVLLQMLGSPQRTWIDTDALQPAAVYMA